MVNKKLLCCILIVCTLITSGTIIYILSDDSMEDDSAGEIVEVKNDKKKDDERRLQVAQDEKKIESQNQKKPETTEKVQESTKKKEVKEFSEEGNPKQSEYNSSLDDKAKSVFKVNVDSIEKSLSTADKAKLLFIGSKLSTVDEGRVKDYLSFGNPEEGVKKAYKLLKQRLDGNDFDKVKDILDKYINIDVVENQ